MSSGKKPSIKSGLTRALTPLAILLLPGCLIGPNYQKPHISMPAQYAFKHGADSAESLTNWWEKFNDPYLNKLMETAVEKNYDLRRAIERIEEVRDLYCIQEAQLFPQVNVTAGASRTKISSTLEQDTFIPVKTFSDYQWGIVSSWELDLFGKLKKAREAAYADYQAQQEYARDVRVVLLADVAGTYVSIQALEQKIDLLNTKIKTDRKLLTLLHDRFASGINSDIPDQQQLQENQEDKNLETILVTARNQAVNRLALLLGEQPESFVFKSKKSTVPVAIEPLKTGLPADLIRKRPDIRTAERQLAAADARVGQAAAERFPSFSFLGAIGTESNAISRLLSHGSSTWSAGLDAVAPLLNFGRIKFNIKAKKSAARQALLYYEETINNALGDVENALIAYFNDRARATILEKKLSAIKREHSLVKAQFTSGLGNLLNVLTIERKILDIRLQITDIQQAIATDLIIAYKALGGGW